MKGGGGEICSILHKIEAGHIPSGLLQFPFQKRLPFPDSSNCNTGTILFIGIR